MRGSASGRPRSFLHTPQTKSLSGASPQTSHCVSMTDAYRFTQTLASAQTRTGVFCRGNAPNNECRTMCYNQESLSYSGLIEVAGLNRVYQTSGTAPLFVRVPPRCDFSSTLYPRSCWCTIQVMHSLQSTFKTNYIQNNALYNSIT